MMFERSGEVQQATRMSGHGTDYMIARQSHRLAYFARVRLIQFCMTICLFTGSLHYDVMWLSRGHRARCLLLLLLSVVVITEC